MSFMFGGCLSLKTVPGFNVNKAANMANMFEGCISLVTVSTFPVSPAISVNMNNIFSGCNSLVRVNGLTNIIGTANGLLNMFIDCFSLASVSLIGSRNSVSFANCKLAKEQLEGIFTTIGVRFGAAATLTLTNNWGADNPITLNGTLAAGSTTVINMANTTGLSTGMQVVGTNTSLTTGRAVTFTDAGDTVNLANHGLSNGDEVAFSTITTTTGIVVNTIYFVRDVVVGSSFKLAATSGGAVLPLTNNGSGTVKYNSTIDSIITNVSITMSRPMAGAVTSLTFRSLQTYRALLKSYTITG
jgi:hypothetical protein